MVYVDNKLGDMDYMIVFGSESDVAPTSFPILKSSFKVVGLWFIRPMVF